MVFLGCGLLWVCWVVRERGKVARTAEKRRGTNEGALEVKYDPEFPCNLTREPCNR